MCERFGSAARLKADYTRLEAATVSSRRATRLLKRAWAPAGGDRLCGCDDRETMLIWVLKAGPAPVTAAAKPRTARQLTTPITATFLAAQRLTRCAKTAVRFVSISDPLSGETRMVSTCRTIARWLMHAGK